jgi:hypothetical protein
MPLGKATFAMPFSFFAWHCAWLQIAEIIGERYGEGGILQWSGIRGGTRALAFQGAETFTLEDLFSLK